MIDNIKNNLLIFHSALCAISLSVNNVVDTKENDIINNKKFFIIVR